MQVSSKEAEDEGGVTGAAGVGSVPPEHPPARE